MHITGKESAPCPAAHVVVMSQCEGQCDQCQFQAVKCLSKKGVTKTNYDDEFMYKKYEDRVESLKEVATQVAASRGDPGQAVAERSGFFSAHFAGLVIAGVSASAAVMFAMGSLRTRYCGAARAPHGFVHHPVATDSDCVSMMADAEA